MCGVLWDAALMGISVEGSSPHVRGFALIRRWSRSIKGFIPACAGFCMLQIAYGLELQVHPRMCGVLRRELRQLRGTQGSSPHVRGFARRRRRRWKIRRFIPACAGFCFSASSSAYRSQVHPRMCGVLGSMPGLMPSATGSSPHVRGFVRLERHGMGSAGFIPACAGFWRMGRGQLGLREVHPRMCGVLATQPSGAIISDGSSPHVRGFAHVSADWSAVQRFIPACAGFWSRPRL